MKTFKGRPVLSGYVKGQSVVSRQGVNLLASFQKSALNKAKTVICSDQNNKDLYGKELTGKILCLPRTIGSTTGGLVLEAAAHLGLQPMALLFSDHIDSLAAAGVILSDRWVNKRIVTVDKLGRDFLDQVQDGRTVEVQQDGTVIVDQGEGEMITLNQEACNHCLTCQAICPNYVFSVKTGAQGRHEIELTYPDQCCECWQCVAICPRDALSAGDVRREDFEQLTSVEVPPDAMRSLLLSRRSIRAYKPDEPPDETIKRLLEVATQAATSSNGQTEGFLVIRDREFLGELEQMVIQAIWNAGLKYMQGRTLNKLFERIVARKYGMEMAKQYRAYFLIIKHRGEHNELRGMIFRNAPVVIVAHGLRMNDLAQTNCALAIRSMEMLALSMGLGSCSVGFLTVASRKSRKINKFLGLPKDRAVYAAMMVGYPQHRIKKVPARKPRDVRWI